MTTATDNAFTKPEVYETRQIQLTSPLLHIGSEVSRLNPFEYVQNAKRVYLPDQEALAKGLLQRGRLQDYLQAIVTREDITPILEQAFGDTWQNETDAEGNPLFPKVKTSHKWTELRITDLRPIIRNGFGQIYIPGTSIKGAIRTAIAYHLIKHDDRYQIPNPTRLSEIEQKLRRTFSRGQLSQREQKFLDDGLFMDQLFTDFSLRYQGKAIPAKQGPNTDFMRAIKVSDSKPLFETRTTTRKGQPRIDNDPIVTEVIVSSHFPDYKAKYRASIYAEMVRNVRTEFTLSLDTEMLSWFHHNQNMQLPFRSIDDILQICQEFAQDQWDFEHDYWQQIKNNPNAQGRNLDFGYIREIYETETCPFHLRLGWSSGMTGVTIDLLLEDELRAEIRDTCGIKAPGFAAPKSRRTVVSSKGEIRFVPGWIKFKVL
jgi:CRISPR-associated protein Csm5